MKITPIMMQVLWAGLLFQFFGLQLFLLLMCSFIILAIIDVFTGYYKNKKSDRTSAKLSLWITVRLIKLILLSIFFVIIWHGITMIDNITIKHIVWIIPMIIAIWRNLSELKSIAENLVMMWVRDEILSGIPWFIDKVFGLWSDIISKGLNYVAKYIWDKIEKKW